VSEGQILRWPTPEKPALDSSAKVELTLH
jgi:hypothetical protein